MIRCPLRIVNKLGLHARAASKFVSEASNFRSEVTLIQNGKEVSGKSIMGVMMLGAARGTELEMVVNGPDEEAAVEALSRLVEERFGESE